MSMKKYSNEELKKMHYHLSLGRSFSTKMVEAVFAGHIKSAFHTPLGQEAIAVGVAYAMRPEDYLCTTHRDECACLIKYDPYKFIAEIFGKDDGTQHGLAFDYHASDWNNGMVTAIGTLGANIPIYAGLAWGLKLQGKDGVVIVSHGDGGSSEGAVTEGWNLASLFKAPFIHLLENNSWAMTVPIERETVNPNLAERAVPYAMKTFVVDGSDLLAVRETMEEAIQTAQNGQPCVVECKVTRWGMHWVGDPTKRHDLDDVEYAKEHKDPLKNYEKYLLDNNVMNENEISEVHKLTDGQMDEWIKKAIEAPVISKDKVFKKELVYATPETGGDL